MTQSVNIQRPNERSKLTTCGCLSCKPVSRKYWVFGCGTFFLLSAIIVGVLWPMTTKKLLVYELQLRPGSLGYDNWVEMPIPMYIRFIMFNWTNPQDIGQENHKPNFAEMGPYVFLEKHVRVNISFHSENGTVSFDLIRTWHFQPDMSSGTLDDKITNVNVFAASAAYTLLKGDRAMLFGLNSLMRLLGTKLTITKTVGELLYSGQDDVSKMGVLTQWDYVNKTRFQRDECSNVGGVTGEPWSMELERKNDLSVFIMDICRPIPLKYKEDYTHNGVPGVRWAADYRAFDNGESYEPNKCYCTGDSCPDLHAGVQNMSDCRFGGPVFTSFPYFYLADEYYINTMTGMNPNQEDHEFSVTLEPNTGIPLRTDAKLQINILIQPNKGLTIFKNIPKLMVPVFWFAQTTELDDDKSLQAKIVSQLPTYGLYAALIISEFLPFYSCLASSSVAENLGKLIR